MSKTWSSAVPAFHRIRDEQPEDSLAIDNLLERAFGGRDEANLVASLRAGGYNLLSLVAEQNSKIVGHLLFTRLPIVGEQRGWEAVALAPLAVEPDHQSHGVGSALMRQGLVMLKERGETIVVVLGHEHYYRKFGFTSAEAVRLEGPFSGPSWMALELTPGALGGVSGRVQYAAPFGC